ncbi:hypothetical protein [Actinocorallia populi]|uniref:hypothetical protein n=1 Tax=Actinocorallia populi TaxID=2079200 RepID=UPI000D08EA70|nr:hypothetical protein [Actinocorallia populi]
MKNLRFLTVCAVALGLVSLTVLLLRSPHLAPIIGALGAITGAVAAVVAVLLSLRSQPQTDTRSAGDREAPPTATLAHTGEPGDHGEEGDVREAGGGPGEGPR